MNTGAPFPGYWGRVDFYHCRWQVLQASEVQEVQVQVEEEQEKARTLDSIVASLRSDLLLAREEQERLQEKSQLQEKEAVEREVVVKAALSKVGGGAKEIVTVARTVAALRREQQEASTFFLLWFVMTCSILGKDIVLDSIL